MMNTDPNAPSTPDASDNSINPLTGQPVSSGAFNTEASPADSSAPPTTSFMPEVIETNTGAAPTPVPTHATTPAQNPNTKKTLTIVGIVAAVLLFLCICCVAGSVWIYSALDLDELEDMIEQQIELELEGLELDGFDAQPLTIEPDFGDVDLADFGIYTIAWNGSATLDEVTFSMDASDPTSIDVVIENNSDQDVDISAIVANGWGMLSDSYEDIGFTYVIDGDGGLEVPAGNTTTITLIPDDNERAIGLLFSIDSVSSMYDSIYFGDADDFLQLMENLFSGS